MKGFHQFNLFCIRCYDDEQKLEERERHPANSRDKHFLLPVSVPNIHFIFYLALLFVIALEFFAIGLNVKAINLLYGQ